MSRRSRYLWSTYWPVSCSALVLCTWDSSRIWRVGTPMLAVWPKSPCPYQLPCPGSFITKGLMVRERTCHKLCTKGGNRFTPVCAKRRSVSAPHLEPFYLFSRHNVSEISTLDIPHRSSFQERLNGNQRVGSWRKMEQNLYLPGASDMGLCRVGILHRTWKCVPGCHHRPPWALLLFFFFF